MSKSVRTQLWKALADSPFIMIGLSNTDSHSEPMTAQLDPDANSAFWIYTTQSNRIAKGGPAMAQFISKSHDLFACISGTLTEETDPNVIDHYWSKQVNAWFKLGRDDPSLCMMRFDLNDAEVWTADPSIKGLFKLIVGKDVDPQEMGQHQHVAL